MWLSVYVPACVLRSEDSFLTMTVGDTFESEDLRLGYKDMPYGLDMPCGLKGIATSSA